MNLSNPMRTSHSPSVKQRRSSRRLLRPLDELARGSPHLFAAHVRYNDSLGMPHGLPKYLFAGPGEKGSYLRVGIFAGLHGDEESGVLAVIEFLERLHARPEFARGYELFVYPVSNAWGYVEGSRWMRSGRDLNRQFWKGSEEVEVAILESQLRKLKFDGLIALHSDDTSEGLYGFVTGHELTRHVLEPALVAAGRILPRNFDKSIDNFEANNGIIEKGYEGVLSAPPEQKPRPFEIVFETPHHAALDKQVEAHIVAMQTILDRFKVMISEAQNI
jgi:protein MpaA